MPLWGDCHARATGSKTAQTQVTQAAQVLAQQQAAKPEGKVTQPAAAPLRHPVAGTTGFGRLGKSRGTADAGAGHRRGPGRRRQQAVSAQEGSRLLAERGQAKLLNAADPDSIPAAQQMATDKRRSPPSLTARRSPRKADSAAGHDRSPRRQGNPHHAPRRAME